MKYSIKHLDFTEHQMFLENLYSYSFFQTPAWIESLINSYPGYYNQSLLFEFTDGVQIFLPLIGIKKLAGIIHTSHSMPFSTYGGLLSVHNGIQSYMDTVVSFIMKGNCWKFVLTPPPFELSEIPYHALEVPLETHFLDLDSDYFKVWEKCYDSKNRNQIRKARKSGMEILINPPDSGKRYFELYKSSLDIRKTRTTLTYPKELFLQLQRFPESMKYYFAVSGLKTYAGIMVFWGKNTAIYWGAAITEEGKPLCANQYLLDYAIQESISNNILKFDLGASKGILSLSKFKESFGAKKLMYSSYVVKKL